MEICAFKLMGGRSERAPLDQAANVFPVNFIHLGMRQGGPDPATGSSDGWAVHMGLGSYHGEPLAIKDVCLK